MDSISLWVISGLRHTELSQRQKVPPRGLSEWVDQTRETKLLQLVGLECLFWAGFKSEIFCAGWKETVFWIFRIEVEIR